MTPRAIGCIGLAAATFVGIGLLAFSMVASPAGCPGRLQWDERGYAAVGTPAASPHVGGAEGEAVEIGSTFIGLGTRRMVAPPGTPPSPTAERRPALVALECGDGTWQTYGAAS